jgi:CheY-like chemotaxis protein
MGPATSLIHPRMEKAPSMILVLEDDPLLADDLADLLGEELGLEVLSLHSLKDAMAMPEVSASFAFLDIDLGDGKAFAFADRLVASGIPFAFLSGSRPQDLPERFRGSPFLSKPYHEVTLLDLVRRHLDQPA